MHKYCNGYAHADPPASPVILNHSLIAANGSENGTAVTLEWISNDAALVHDVAYTVTVFYSAASPMSVFTDSNTSIQLFIRYNKEYNISVVASNCAGNSTPAKATLRIGNHYHVIIIF